MHGGLNRFSENMADLNIQLEQVMLRKKSHSKSLYKADIDISVQEKARTAQATVAHVNRVPQVLLQPLQ